jgi:hypothetical protein
MDHVADRRLRIAVRLVLYPLALGLIVLVWQRHHSDAAQTKTTDPVTWSGTTGQGQAVRAVTTNGILTRLNTHVVEHCSDGSVFTLYWTPTQQRLVQHGEDVGGVDKRPGYSYSGEPVVYDDGMWAHVGAHPYGSISAQDSWTKDGRTVQCHSGPVAFELQRVL